MECVFLVFPIDVVQKAKYFYKMFQGKNVYFVCSKVLIYDCMKAKETLNHLQISSYSGDK